MPRVSDVMPVTLDAAENEPIFKGRSAYSTYNVEPDLQAHIDRVFSKRPSMMPGPEFYQSDHAILAMQGRAALAITTERVSSSSM